MNLDKKIIKALASDRKREILKSLAERRKTSTEISKQLNLAPSTAIEHVKQLEVLKLIKRIETGNKWIYYELTQDGKDLIKPSFPIKIVLVLSLGFIMLFGGFFGMFPKIFQSQTFSKQMAAAEALSSEVHFDNFYLLFVVLFVIGFILIAYAIWNLRK